MANNLDQPVSYYIPMVLMYDILSRLPVKSLIRFQSVCKTWYHLIIENPNFIQTHNSIQSTLQHKPSFTAMLLYINNRIKIHYSDDAFHKQFDFQLPNLFMNDFHVMGICNGLICATEAPDSSEYIIFNPTTRKFRKICPFNPTTRKFRKTCMCKSSDCERDIVFLWFGLLENGYNLLKIIITWDSEVPIIRGELYCLGNGSWQEIEVNLGGSLPILYDGYYHHRPNHRQALMLDGVLFWKDEYYAEDSGVAYFDIRKKVFDLIESPFDICYLRGWELLEVNHKLGVVVNAEGWIEVCLLDEDMKGFTKIHRVECPTCSGYPPNRDGFTSLLGCSRKGEVIIEDDHKNNSMLLLYDLDSSEMKYLYDADVEGLDSWPDWNSECVYVYNASLTPVD